jgi:hypothetical protein
MAIPKSSVVDLTSKTSADGTLHWTPPDGKWVVLRFGYSLLGITNHPATPEATGLEVDKLDHRFVKDYFEKYLDSYKETVGADEMGKKGIRYVIIVGRPGHRTGPIIYSHSSRSCEVMMQSRGYLS